VSWPTKPAADDRLMVGGPCEAADESRDTKDVAKAAGNIAALFPPIRRKR